MSLYNRLEWQRRINEEKAESVCRALSLPTHNGYTKDDLIMMLDWCFHEMYECDKPCLAYQKRCECLRVVEGGAGNICKTTNLPCIRCNPGACGSRAEEKGSSDD